MSLHARFRAKWVHSLEMRQIRERRDAEGRSIEETATGGGSGSVVGDMRNGRTGLADSVFELAELYRDRSRRR